MNVWSEILPKLEQKLKKDGNEKYYKLLEGSYQQNHKDGVITIILKSEFAIDFIREYYSDFLEELLESMGIEGKIEMVAANTIPPVNTTTNKIKKVQEEPDEWEYLNDQYTFENFVEYSNNRVAVQIAKQIAERPGSKLNPLLIYGGVGLGKTHLMHAIGNRVKEKFPESRIAYIMINKFMDEFIDSIKNQNADKFKKRFFSFDVILIDDIQFIAKTESFQDELFHIFNDFYHKRKQIVITSDRPLRDIAGLKERLMSRFNSGAVVDIQKPNVEARIAIIKKKLEQENMYLDEDSIFYIANNIKSNIRDLHAAIVNIYARISVEKIDKPTIDIVKEIVNNYITKGTRKVTIDDVLKKVCEYFDISEKQIMGKSRKKEIALARQISMYLSQEICELSLSQIGKFYGKHHSTVMHSIEKIKNEIKTNDDVRKYVEEIVSKLKF